MQNNFEKEVRQKLDDLRMQPSVPVWEKVQLEIQPARRKRRGIFWMLLLAGVVVGGLGIVKLSNKQEEPIAQQPSTNEPTSAESQEKIAVKIPAHSKQTLSRPSTKANNDTAAKRETSTSPLAVKRVQAAQPVVKALTTSTLSAETNPGNDGHNEFVSAKKTRFPVKQDLFVRPSAIALNSILFVPSITIPVGVAPLPHQLSAVTAAIKAFDSLQKQNDSSSKMVRNTKAGWRKMVAVSVGYSNYNSGLFNLIGVEKAMAADVRNSLYAGPGNSLGGGSTIQQNGPSSVLPGISISIAGFIEKPISRRTELMLGLSYSYHRIIQPLGMLNGFDTTVNSSGRTVALSSFYTTGDSNHYTNRIHAISLSIGINWQVHKRLPLFACIALAYGKIISIDAVAYSASSNLFFKENADEDYMKHQLPLSIGLAYRFRIGATQSLAVGPTATYQLLRLNTAATNNAQHLSFVGIQTSLRF